MLDFLARARRACEVRAMRLAVALVLLSTLVVVAPGCGPGGPDPGITMEGRWAGDLESGLLPSGSSMVVLQLDRARSGEAILASVIFGEGTAPSAPTDGERGWPMGVDPQLSSTVPVADGFAYQAVGGARMGTRLRADIGVTALWAPWCALQTPYRIAEGSEQSLCLPNRPWTATPFECHLDADESLPEQPVDCLKLTLCRRTRVCDCTAERCEPSASGLTMYLDLNFDDDSAVGVIAWTTEGGMGTGSGTARVRLTRQ